MSDTAFVSALLALVAIVGLLVFFGALLVVLTRNPATTTTLARPRTPWSYRYTRMNRVIWNYLSERRNNRRELAEQRRRIDELIDQLELQTRINGEYRRNNSRSVDALTVLADDLNRRVGGLEAREQQATTIYVYQEQVIERNVERRANRLAVVICAIIGAIMFGGVLWLFVPPGEYLFGGYRFLISDNVHSWAAVSMFSLLGAAVFGGIASRVFTTRVTDENTVRNVEVQEGAS